MPFQPVTFENETNIRYDFRLETVTNEYGSCRILLVSFTGTYRPGHYGTPDAFFMQGITQTGLKLWRADALVFDLRRLSYIWGDDMEEVLGMRGEIPVPFAIVGSDLCLPAIGTLIQPFHSKKQHIFDNMEEALKYIHQIPRAADRV